MCWPNNPNTMRTMSGCIDRVGGFYETHGCLADGEEDRAAEGSRSRALHIDSPYETWCAPTTTATRADDEIGEYLHHETARHDRPGGSWRDS